MSSCPRTVVGAGMYGAGVAPMVGYTNGSDGATPLCHIFKGLIRLLPFFAEFSTYSARHATDGTAGTTWGPRS